MTPASWQEATTPSALRRQESARLVRRATKLPFGTLLEAMSAKDEKPESWHGFNIKQIAGIAAGAVVFLAIIFAVMLAKRKRRARALDAESGDLTQQLKAKRLMSERADGERWIKAMHALKWFPPLALLILPCWCHAKSEVENIDEELQKTKRPNKKASSEAHLQKHLHSKRPKPSTTH